MLVSGGGGHARVVLDALVAQGSSVRGILERDPSRWGTQVLGVPVLGDDGWPDEHLRPDDVTVVVAVVGFGRAERRRALLEDWRRRGYALTTVLHPAAVLSPFAEVRDGTQVLANAVVNAGALIGRDVIVNTGAVVEHDGVVEEGAHVAPGAVLAGGASVGRWAQIGIHATILPGCRVGEGAVVGAGAVVTRDVAPRSVVVGVPARPVQSPT